MAFSFLMLFYIYFPILKLYIFPPTRQLKITNQSFYIEIPKIKVTSPIIANVDPFNEKEYRNVLEKGIAHAKGTKLPGELGTSFLFGHSSDLPWRLTRYNTVFLRLGELEKGDEIVIGREGKVYRYKVTDKKTVWPSEVQYLIDASQSSRNESRLNRGKLILQTCTPIGTSLMRLLVFAELIR